MCCDSSLYAYTPSKVAPILFLVAFLLSTLHHIYLNYRFKSWKVAGALPWGGSLFVAAFAVREASAFHPQNLDLFIASTVLLLLAPPVYALLNYVVLGRTLYYIPHLSPIYPGRAITTFVGLDVVIGIISANGGAKFADPDATPSELSTGRALRRASILLQLISFFLFVLLEAVFHRRCQKAGILAPKPTPEARQRARKVRRVLYLMYISSAIISSRHVFRVVDVWQGPQGYLHTHEWPLYIFDGLIMFVNALMLNIRHPMRYLPSDIKIYLSKDGTTERLGPGWDDSRSFLIGLIDPFDLLGLLLGRRRDKFWERDDEHPVVGQEDTLKPNKGDGIVAAV
ncbi:MAG: hypothetical protein Q9211_002028 [Gyalolechia sp. 1 TL-2023]